MSFSLLITYTVAIQNLTDTISIRFPDSYSYLGTGVKMANVLYLKTHTVSLVMSGKLISTCNKKFVLAQL